MTRGRTIKQLLLTATSTLPMLFAVGCADQRTQSVNKEPENAVASVQQASSTSRTMVGYWHNFDNKISTPTFRLANVDSSWDVVVVAFADDAGSGKVAFNLDTSTGLTVSQFKTDIQTLQAAGKKVILSLGGQNGTMTLTDDTTQTNFQNSMKCLLKKQNYSGSACTCNDTTCFGFDGVDLDLEAGVQLVHGSAVQTRLPNAVTNIAADWEADRSGQDFFLTMTPETPYVQGATIAYSGIWGSYIPIIEALRNELDILQVQLYNNGGLNTPYAAGAYGVGTVDDLVSAQVMLIQGFTCAGGHVFTGLNPSQVAIGVPTGAGASNDGASFTTANLVKAMDCLTKGTNCDTVKPGAKDVNGNVYWPSGTTWSNFRGAMTWSINWDVKLGGSWHTTIRNYLDQGAQSDTTAPSTPGTPSVSSNTTNAVALTWTASTDNVGVTGYKIARSLDNGSTWNDLPTTTTTNSFTDTSVAANTAYKYKVAARDAASNWSAYSSVVSVTTPAGSDTTKPSVPGGLAVGTMSSSSVPLTWTASTDNVGVAGYRIYRDGTLVNTVTGSPPATSFTDTTVGPAKTYVFQVLAYDAAGNASDLGTGLSVTTPAASGGNCTASAYSNNHSPAYVVGDQVSNLGCISGLTGGTGSSCVTGTPAMRQYQCKVAGWCGLPDYAPGYGWAWTYAWDYKSDCSAASGDTTAPSVPTSLASSTQTTTSITLTWTGSTDNVGVTGYNVFRGANKIGTASSATYTDSSLTPSTTYAYQVQAYDAAGNVSGHTATVNVTTAAAAGDTQAPSVPGGLTKGTITSTSIAFSWSASTDNVGVTGYDVYRSGSKVGSATSLSYTDSGLAANTSYNYTVTAKDAAGNVSAQSSVLAAVTTSGATGCPGLTEWAGAQSSACYYPSLSYMSYKGKKYQAKDANCMYGYCVPDGSGGYGACGWTLVGACQ